MVYDKSQLKLSLALPQLAELRDCIAHLVAVLPASMLQIIGSVENGHITKLPVGKKFKYLSVDKNFKFDKSSFYKKIKMAGYHDRNGKLIYTTCSGSLLSKGVEKRKVTKGCIYAFIKNQNRDNFDMFSGGALILNNKLIGTPIRAGDFSSKKIYKNGKEKRVSGTLITASFIK